MNERPTTRTLWSIGGALLLVWIALEALAAWSEAQSCDANSALPWLRCEKDFRP
jgi:hypothetical protein